MILCAATATRHDDVDGGGSEVGPRGPTLSGINATHAQ